MKYFLHDTSAFDDEKIIELYKEFGYEGLGLFYTILEKIGKQEKPVKTDVLKFQLHVGKKLDKCWNFMEGLGLIHSNNGDTFNKQLLNFSETYSVKKEKNRERIAQWRENQKDIENVTHYESVSNTPKVKRSKVKRSKEKGINLGEKIKTHFFKDSQFFLFDKFSEEIERDEKYKMFDLRFYHESAKNWSEEGNVKINWIATVKNWMLRDLKNNEARLKKEFQNGTESKFKKGNQNRGYHPPSAEELADAVRERFGKK